MKQDCEANHIKPNSDGAGAGNAAGTYAPESSGISTQEGADLNRKIVLKNDEWLEGRHVQVNERTPRQVSPEGLQQKAIFLAFSHPTIKM